MANLINAAQEKLIRKTFDDLVDTFPTEIKIYKFTREEAENPFDRQNENYQIYEFTAIREADRSKTENEFRNDISEESSKIESYYIHYDDFALTDLLNEDGTNNLTHNDFCGINGERFSILYANPIASMTTKPVFFQLILKRAFFSENVSSLPAEVV